MTKCKRTGYRALLQSNGMAITNMTYQQYAVLLMCLVTATYIEQATRDFRYL